MIKYIWFFIFLFICQKSWGNFHPNYVPEDSIPKKKWHQTRLVKIGLTPLLLTTYGLSVMHNQGIYSSQAVQDDLQEQFPGFQTKLDDHLALVPTFVTYGLKVFGVRGKHNLVNSTFIYVIANGVQSGLVSWLKEVTNVERPDGSNFSSFPSFHTSTAFTAATFMHEEFKHKSVWYSIGAYTVASGTGFLRMMNNKHWMSDVLVGAGIGILSVKLTYLIYPWIQKKVAEDQAISTLWLPKIQSDQIGLSLHLILK